MKEETLLRNAIRDALLRIGVLCWTNAQVGRTYHGGLGKGSADLILCVGGRFAGMEVKVGREQPSTEQQAWGDQVRDHGGEYFVVRSVADAIVAVRSLRRPAA